MNDAAEQILVELARLEAEIAAAPEVPRWRYPAAQEQVEARLHGPRWSMITSLAENDATRMRLGRARDQLEAAGLVECWRHEFSQRTYRLRLTTAGKKAAAEVAAESVP
jgi:hypothetical protein